MRIEGLVRVYYVVDDRIRSSIYKIDLEAHQWMDEQAIEFAVNERREEGAKPPLHVTRIDYSVGGGN